MGGDEDMDDLEDEQPKAQQEGHVHGENCDHGHDNKANLDDLDA